MRSYIEDIMYDRRKDFASLPLRFVLRILSVMYRNVISVRNYLYDKRVFMIKDVTCRVVSIGNLTIGGTGKTPVAVMTVKYLKEEGYSVAVVSRGYGRKGKKPLIVSDSEKIIANPGEAGDEPLIIASSLPGVPVVVGADRYRAAQIACRHFKPDVIVLDDALQHRRLYRNVDVVTLDAENLYGNECLLPRGILRESPRAISRAKAIVITRFHNGLHRDRIERMVRYYDRNVPVFWSEHVPSALHQPGTDVREDFNMLRGIRVAALSNIACPESFHRTLVSLGADIAVYHIMNDHHQYNVQELERIERESLDAGSNCLVMTAKDERNLPDSYRFNRIQAFVLDIEATLMEQSDVYLKIVAPKKIFKITGENHGT